MSSCNYGGGWRQRNSTGWPQSYPQSSHLGNVAPVSQVLGSMPGRQHDLKILVFPVPTEPSASLGITHRCVGRLVVSVHLLYYHRQL